MVVNQRRMNWFKFVLGSRNNFSLLFFFLKRDYISQHIRKGLEVINFIYFIWSIDKNFERIIWRSDFLGNIFFTRLNSSSFRPSSVGNIPKDIHSMLTWMNDFHISNKVLKANTLLILTRIFIKRIVWKEVKYLRIICMNVFIRYIFLFFHVYDLYIFFFFFYNVGIWIEKEFILFKSYNHYFW